MVPQEPVHRAVNHQEVGRVPTHFSRTPAVSARLGRHSGRLGVALSACLGDDIPATPFDPWECYGSASSEDVVEEVQLRPRQLAPGGEYALAPSHAVQADSSVEKVLALVNAALDFGRHPISL